MDTLGLPSTERSWFKANLGTVPEKNVLLKKKCRCLKSLDNKVESICKARSSLTQQMCDTTFYLHGAEENHEKARFKPHVDGSIIFQILMILLGEKGLLYPLDVFV